MISLIAAIGRDLEIGWQGRLPWHLPNDLRHFKEVTKNKTIIMGSDSISVWYLNHSCTGMLIQHATL